VVASFVAPRSCSTLSPVSAAMGDRLWAGIPPRYVTKPTRSTQPCIPLGSRNRVLALIGWGNVTSAGWQLTLCDQIWHVSSRSGAVLVAQTAIRFLTLPKAPIRTVPESVLTIFDEHLDDLRRVAGIAFSGCCNRYEAVITDGSLSITR